MKKSNEPIWWSLFSAGGMIAAMVFPILIIITGFLIPLTMPPTVPLWMLALATIFGVFSGFSYIGVGFTPSDLYLDAHIFFAHWAFRALFAASILYSILILKTDGFEKRYAFGFIIFGIMVFSYVIYSEVVLDDPRINPDALVNHVVAQKMIAFWILFAVYIYSIGLGKYLYRKV